MKKENDNNNKKDVKNSITPEKQEAINKVAKVVNELKGDRSIRKTSADSGVAASYITGILKARYLPSAEILKKLTSPEAKPQNGITLEDLMISAGYQNNYHDSSNLVVYTDDGKPLYIEVMGTHQEKEDIKESAKVNEKILANPENEKKNELRERDVFKAFLEECSRYESAATGIVYKALMEKRIAFSPLGGMVAMRGFKADLAINIDGQKVKEWWFNFKLFKRDGKDKNKLHEKGRMYTWFTNILASMMFIEPKADRKLSIVVRNMEEYEFIRSYIGKIAFKSDLSVILVDMDYYCVLKEEYLSYYNNDDNEIYLK